MSPEERAFLEAICTHPADDNARLVYADWLDEHDQAEWAEFIRVQIELAKIRAAGGVDGVLSHREFVLLNERADDWFTLDGWKPQRTGGRSLHVEYWAQGAEWVGAGEAGISRGFVSHITCTAADFLRHADALHWHPSQTVRCEACRDVRDADRRVFGTDAGVWCKACDSTGTVPRPFPPTAHPVERVTLTDWPGVVVCAWGDDSPTSFGLAETDAGPVPDESEWVEMERHSDHYHRRELTEKLLARRWPGITFALPAQEPAPFA